MEKIMKIRLGVEDPDSLEVMPGTNCWDTNLTSSLVRNVHAENSYDDAVRCANIVYTTLNAAFSGDQLALTIFFKNSGQYDLSPLLKAFKKEMIRSFTGLKPPTPDRKLPRPPDVVKAEAHSRLRLGDFESFYEHKWALRSCFKIGKGCLTSKPPDELTIEDKYRLFVFAKIIQHLAIMESNYGKGNPTVPFLEFALRHQIEEILAHRGLRPQP